MKKMVTILGAMLTSSTVFAATGPAVKCEKQLYSAAVKVLIERYSFETQGVSVKLDGVSGMQGTTRTYEVKLIMTTPTGFSRDDSYQVILTDFDSCHVKSALLISG